MKNSLSLTFNKKIKNIKNTLLQKGEFYLCVKVIPNSSKNDIVEFLNDENETIKIRVRAKAEKGLANKELKKFLAKFFQCSAEILNGKTNNIKLIKLFR